MRYLPIILLLVGMGCKPTHEEYMTAMRMCTEALKGCAESHERCNEDYKKLIQEHYDGKAY